MAPHHDTAPMFCSPSSLHSPAAFQTQTHHSRKQKQKNKTKPPPCLKVEENPTILLISINVGYNNALQSGPSYPQPKTMQPEQLWPFSNASFE